MERHPRFKYAYKGGTLDGHQLLPLQKVTESELTRRFRQAAQVLWGAGKFDAFQAFDEFHKLIFCKLWDERRSRRQGEPYDFQVIAEHPVGKSGEALREAMELQTNEALLARVKALYELGRERDPTLFQEPIRLNASKLRAVVACLEDVDLSNTDLDSKGRAFETFLGSFFRRTGGQYFTPRPIVKFMVDVLPITHKSLVLDVAAGSGGFLWHVLDKVGRQLDHRYKPGTARNDAIKRNFAERNLYGIEINERIARVAKMHMFVHGNNHANIVACDGLLPIEEIAARTGNSGFARSRFDLIVTNPPFGSVIKRIERDYLNQCYFATREADWLNPKSRAFMLPKQTTEVIFIEQCWNFLTAGGYLAIVIPNGLTNNPSLQHVREGIMDLFRLVAVVSLPDHAFMPTGAGVGCSVMFLRKLSAVRTKKLRSMKQRIKEHVLTKEGFGEGFEALDIQRKESFANILRSPDFAGLREADIKRTSAYKKHAERILAEFDTKLDELRCRASERFGEIWGKEVNLADLNYEIFMSIAEEVGYSPTGGQTKGNDLVTIAEELEQFIEAVEKDGDFFSTKAGISRGNPCA